ACDAVDRRGHPLGDLEVLIMSEEGDANNIGTARLTRTVLIDKDTTAFQFTEVSTDGAEPIRSIPFGANRNPGDATPRPRAVKHVEQRDDHVGIRTDFFDRN